MDSHDQSLWRLTEPKIIDHADIRNHHHMSAIRMIMRWECLTQARWHRHDGTGTMARDDGSGTGTLAQARWHRQDGSGTQTIARARWLDCRHKNDGTGTMAQARSSGHSVNGSSTIHIGQDGTGTLARAQWHRHYHDGSVCTGTMAQVRWYESRCHGHRHMARAQE